MLSIVIPAYNEEKTIRNCLDSLLQQRTGQKFEVIIVDNGSTDQTRVIVHSYKAQLPLVYIRESQRGRGRARATGFNRAKGEIVFSTDADTIVPQNWIEVLSNVFRDSNVVAVRGFCRITDCSWVTNMQFNYLFPLFPILFRICFGYWTIAGFNSAIRKDAYDKVGGFDTELDSEEDVELSMRLHKEGKINVVRLAVTVSGRRLKKGFFRGIIPYLRNGWFVFILRRKNIQLQNIR